MKTNWTLTGSLSGQNIPRTTWNLRSRPRDERNFNAQRRNICACLNYIHLRHTACFELCSAKSIRHGFYKIICDNIYKKSLSFKVGKAVIDVFEKTESRHLHLGLYYFTTVENSPTSAFPPLKLLKNIAYRVFYKLK